MWIWVNWTVLAPCVLSCSCAKNTTTTSRRVYLSLWLLLAVGVQQQAGWQAGWQRKAESSHLGWQPWVRENEAKSREAFNLKDSPQPYASSSKGVEHKLSYTPVGEQMFKCPRLWGHFSFRELHVAHGGFLIAICYVGKVDWYVTF